MKNLFITEKPSVGVEFAKALKIGSAKKDGFIEGENNIVTWCVGHLIEMSYPEKYDESLKEWKLDTLPFLPDPKKYKYEVIKAVASQFKVVKELLNRKDIGAIYYSGDSAREGEYIQRLVRMIAGHNSSAVEKRVWIDSQTEEEIFRGIQEAKPLSAYDNLSESAYARAIEDYGIGINFSRAISLKYSNMVYHAAGEDPHAIAIGRVMSCVLGMIVERERQIRDNVRIPYYTVDGITNGLTVSWQALETSSFYTKTDLYKDIGFLKRDKAENFTVSIEPSLTYSSLEKKKESKKAPLLFNLAELQGECTKLFHIGPDKTLEIAQKLYEAKMTTYPRTDARVLTTAICKEIQKNISGLTNVAEVSVFARDIMEKKAYQGIDSTKYTDDSAVSDHYAIIPTGDVRNMSGLSGVDKEVYLLICRRFLSIFYPAALYEKITAVFTSSKEPFYLKLSRLVSPGWLSVADKIPDQTETEQSLSILQGMKEGQTYPAEYIIKDKETEPPKRYTSGSMILAMENAGNLIEEEELREQIKGSGIGTSATRAETIKKLHTNKYISINTKQIITPTALGECIYEVLKVSLPMILSPKMTASWEKGLSQIEQGSVSQAVYLDKMYQFIRDNTEKIKASDYTGQLEAPLATITSIYKINPNKNKVPEDIVCPLCGAPLAKIKTGAIGCTNYKETGCKFYFSNKYAGKILSMSQMVTLLKGGTTGVIKGLWSEKKQKKYDAKLTLENGRIRPVFDNNKE